jgi:hypothetical protein
LDAFYGRTHIPESSMQGMVSYSLGVDFMEINSERRIIHFVE